MTAAKTAKSFFSTTIGKITAGVLIIVIAFVLVFATWHISAFVNRQTEHKSSASIREEIVPIAQLATYEYNFTQVLRYTSTETFSPINIDIPFSENWYIATVDGTVTIYTDVSKMEVTPQNDSNGEIKSIDIALPHAQPKDPVTIDPNSVTELYKKDGFFNPVTTDNYTDLLKITNTEQLEKANNNDLLQKADTRIQDLISDFIRKSYGTNIEINFTFLEEAQNSEA